MMNEVEKWLAQQVKLGRSRELIVKETLIYGDNVIRLKKSGKGGYHIDVKLGCVDLKNIGTTESPNEVAAEKGSNIFLRG